MRIVFAAPIALLLLIVIAGPPLGSRNTAYGAYNDNQRGTGLLFETDQTQLLPALQAQGKTVRLIHESLADLDPAREALLAVSPGRGYRNDEIQAVHTYLANGGRMLLADDRGAAKGLLEGLNIGVGLPGVSIFTVDQDPTGRDLVAATGLVPGLPAFVSTSRPSIVIGTGEPVLVTSRATWLDTNDNARPDVGEEPGSFAVAQLAPVGNGELLVVGDPDLLIDPATADAFVAWLTARHVLLAVDEAHRPGADSLGLASYLARPLPGWLQGIVLVSLLVAGTAFTIRFRPRRTLPKRRPPPLRPDLTRGERRILSELEP